MSTEAGLTLVEVLVAAFLIGVALVPLMQLYPQILEADQQSERSTIIGAAAGRKMEELIAGLRADIDSVTSGAETCGDLPSCRIEWTISTETSSGAQGVGSLKTVSVASCMDADGSGTCEDLESPVRYDAKVTSRP
jgi:Tfp pilus assembly protein PilV